MTTLPAISLWQPWATLCATPVECPICHGREPWNCTLSLNGPHMVKRFETRSWPCPPKYIGQRIAIHAAKRPPAGPLSSIRIGDYLIRMTPSRKVVMTRVDDRSRPIASDVALPLGAVVATAIVTASLPVLHADDELEEAWMPHVAENLNGLGHWRGRTAHDGPMGRPTWVIDDITDQLPYGDWTPGRYAWQLDDVQPLEQPVPATGRQGWFPVDLP